MKTLQKFSDTALAASRDLSIIEILDWLEDFRLLMESRGQGKSKLISIKVPEVLLNAFKRKAAAAGIPYQTQIKALMRDWVEGKL